MIIDVEAAAPFKTTLRVEPERQTTPRATARDDRRLEGDDEMQKDVRVSRPAGGQRRREQMRRRKSEKKRPKHYWSDVSNIERELRSFWEDDCGIDIDAGRPPPIPNEMLLRSLDRHDLRGAIVRIGGRDALSEMLGKAPIVPGPWRDAVRESPELRRLIADCAIADGGGGELPLEPDRLSPPAAYGLISKSRRGMAEMMELQDIANDSYVRRWSHRSGRKPKGYWTLRVVIQELYEYVDEYRERHGRPSVWMPRSSELMSNGREGLGQAMRRFGGADRIRELAGMVPHGEWKYFEGQLELVLGLVRYIDEHRGSDYSQFPSATDIRRKGYDRLYSLVQYYGGCAFLSLRFGMSSTAEAEYFEMNWGPFDLLFAARLLSFVRDEQLRKNPPLDHPVIGIPSPSRLLASADRDGNWLHEKICEFGGYENVARRLGLAFD